MIFGCKFSNDLKLLILSSLGICFAVGGCGDGESSTPADPNGGEDSDELGDTEAHCEFLFGTPSENTGQGSDSCRAECRCDGETWLPISLTSEQVARLSQAVDLNPPSALSADPYEDGTQPAAGSNEVCGVIFDNLEKGEYHLETFEDEAEAEQSSATVTHHGPCGRCSSLQDLAVYISQTDLTAPVRQCGIEGITLGREASMTCLQEIGFSSPCAEIWYYNTAHTRKECLDVCLKALNENQPHLLPDGSLNPCLQCDEDKSGPVFKAVAGRTRRNSGLPSALCRPCESVSRVAHRYPIFD